jgi:hypothetical protein
MSNYTTRKKINHEGAPGRTKDQILRLYSSFMRLIAFVVKFLKIAITNHGGKRKNNHRVLARNHTNKHYR